MVGKLFRIVSNQLISLASREPNSDSNASVSSSPSPLVSNQLISLASREKESIMQGMIIRVIVEFPIN